MTLDECDVSFVIFTVLVTRVLRWTGSIRPLNRLTGFLSPGVDETDIMYARCAAIVFRLTPAARGTHR